MKKVYLETKLKESDLIYYLLNTLSPDIILIETERRWTDWCFYTFSVPKYIDFVKLNYGKWVSRDGMGPEILYFGSIG